METALSTPAETAIAPMPVMPDLSAVSKAGSWLARIQFFSAKSKEVSENKIPANHYGIVRDKKLVDVGDRVDVVVVAARSKAMRFGEKIITCYDPKIDPVSKQATGIFAEITQAADSNNEELKMSNMYGPEYLLWLPDEGYVTFFMGTKSSRRESAHLTGLCTKYQPTFEAGLATISSQLAKTKKFSWWTPKVEKCVGEFDTPTMQELATEANKFLAEKGSEVVSAADAGAAADSDDR